MRHIDPVLRYDPSSGLFPAMRQVPSPNCDDRPPGIEVDLVIVHGISLPPGRFGGPYIDQLFGNTLDIAADPYFVSIGHQRLSAHLLIDRNGGFTQYVPLGKRAWHAGVSEFCGRTACNDFSIGVELEGADEIPYTGLQYSALRDLIGVLSSHFPRLAADRIVGHCDVAPGRKTDPGPAFDWRRLRAMVREGDLPQGG
jgi:AmpD protein